jgi:hypothetical protein
MMDGLKFIAAAREVDPNLGYVVLSAFDTDENLRRSIPLQVYEFIPKPLPDRNGFEERLPDWIERTRLRRRQHELAAKAKGIALELDLAKLEREVELVASESARDALLQTAGLLTTIHAHLVAATTTLSSRARNDVQIGYLLRGLEEARKTADAAISATEGFYNSGYGNRDASLALPATGTSHAIEIALRMCDAGRREKRVDVISLSDHVPIQHLSGIDYLLMIVPVLAAALTLAEPKTTVRVCGEGLAHLESIFGDGRFRGFLWVNRRNAMIPHSGILITVTSPAKPFSTSAAEEWLNSKYEPLEAVTARGLVKGIQKCRGILGLAVAPNHQCKFVLALPT